MKNLVLFIDKDNNASEDAAILRRNNSLFMYERYEDYNTAFKRIVKNNFDIMVANLDIDKTCNVNALIRANYNIGKYTVVKYSSVWQKMKFMMSNLDILDNVKLVKSNCSNGRFINAVRTLSEKPTIPFGQIFQKYI